MGTQKNERAALLRELAATLRANPNDRDAIPLALETIADCMEPCVDCGHDDEKVPADYAYLVKSESAETVTEINA